MNIIATHRRVVRAGRLRDENEHVIQSVSADGDAKASHDEQDGKENAGKRAKAETEPLK